MKDTVYVVMQHRWDKEDSHILGVFKEQEKAKSFIDDYWSIEQEETYSYPYIQKHVLKD